MAISEENKITDERIVSFVEEAKAKGVTREQMMAAIDNLQFASTVNSETDELGEQIPVNFNENMRNKILEQFPQNIKQSSKEDVLPGTQHPQPVFGQVGVDDILAGEDFTLSDFDGQHPNVVVRSNEASTELGNLIAPVIKSESTQVAAELMSGDETALVQAQDVVAARATERAYENAGIALQNAQTPEETLQVMEETKIKLNEPVSIASLRENYIAERLNPKPEQLDSISSRIRTSAYLAGEKDKAMNKIWEGTTFWEAVTDFGEFLTPTGIASEEIMKYQNTIDSFIEDVVDARSVQEQQEIIESMVETWANSETILFGNNNSLMTVDRIDSAKNALLDVGLGLSDGSVSREQAEDILMTALEGTFIAGEIKQIGRGLKGLMKFIAHKIFPSDAPRTGVKAPALEGEFLGKEALPAPERQKLLPHFRNSSRAIDTEYTVKPDNFVVEKQEGTANLTRSSGLRDEEAVDRMMPNIDPEGDVAFGNIADEMDEITDAILADETAANMGMKRARALQRETGNTLKVVDSGSSILPSDNPDVPFKFKFTYGDTNKKGFETQADAEAAAKNGFGDMPYRTRESNGQWYVEVEMDYKFDPRKDVTDLGIDNFDDFRWSGGDISMFFKDPARILGTELLDSLYALKGVNRDKVTKQLNKFNESTKRLSRKQSIHLNKALKYGDDNGVEFTTKSELADSLGLPESSVSNKVWDSYKQTRQIMDDIYEARNASYRAAKESKGYKILKGKEGADDLMVRPVSRSELEGDVLDYRTGNKVEGDLDEMVVVRSDEPILGNDGRLYNQLVIDPADTTRLPTQLLRKRKGHIDRGYRETGYTVQRVGTRTVNGVQKAHTSTVAIVKSRKEAEDLLAKLQAEEPDAQFSTLRARENSELDVIYGDSDSVQFSYSSTHSAKRGEQLKGSDGLKAPILSPLESIQKSIYGLQREYDANMIQSLKQRFLNQFAPYLNQKGGTPWARSLDDMMSTSREIPSEVHSAAKAWHTYITGLQHAQRSEVFNWLDNLLEGMFSKMGLSVGADTAAISAKMQRLTANLIILGRPLYQIPQNLFQATYVALRDPVSGARAIAQFPFILPHLMGMDTNFKLAGKVLGVSPEVAKDLIKTIKSSGMWDSVGRMDDILELAGDEMTQGATGFWKYYAKKYGAGAVKKPFDMSRTLQEGSLKLTNLYTYLAEFHRQVVAQKKPFNAKTKADISAATQKLLQTQNGMNQFLYQNKGNVAAITMQFMQHTHKLFLDVVADPLLMSTTGKSTGKAVSPYADTRKQAALTTGAVFTLFGFNGIFGEHGGQYFSDKLRENVPDLASDPSVRSFVDGGLINEFFNTAFISAEKGRVDVSAKVNPASFVDSLYTHFLENFGSLDMFGATGSTAGSVLDAGKAVAVLASNPVMDSREKVFNMAAELSELVKGVGDAERAYIAMNTQQWPYINSLSGSLRVTDEEALFALFNVTPTMVADYQRQKSITEGKGTKDAIELSKVFVKAMNRELALRKADGTIQTIQDVNEITEKYVHMAKAVVEPMAYDEVSGTFRKFALDVDAPTYKEYIRPYINTDTMDDSIKGLIKLEQIATTPEARQEVKAALEFMRSVNEQHKVIYGEQ